MDCVAPEGRIGKKRGKKGPTLRPEFRTYDMRLTKYNMLSVSGVPIRRPRGEVKRGLQLEKKEGKKKKKKSRDNLAEYILRPVYHRWRGVIFEEQTEKTNGVCWSCRTTPEHYLQRRRGS